MMQAQQPRDDPAARLQVLLALEAEQRGRGMQPSAGLLLEKADLLEELARYPEALDVLLELQAGLPGADVAMLATLHKRVAGLLFQLSRYEESLVSIVESAKLLSGAGLEEDWELAKLRGNCFSRIGRQQEALNSYGHAQAILAAAGQPGNPALLLNRGAVYIAMGQFDNALESMAEAERMYRETGEKVPAALEMNRGVLFASLSRPQEALAAYKRAEELTREAGQPESVNLLMNRGVALVQLGRIEEALAQFNRSEELRQARGQRSSVVLLFHRALAYHRQGRQERAVEEAARTIRECSSQRIAVDPFIAETLQDWLLNPEGRGRQVESQDPPAESVASPEKLYDAFICYRRNAAMGHAMLLKTHLDLNGRTVFRDQDNLPGGQFRDELERAVRASRCLIVLLTPDIFVRDNGGEEDFVVFELATALRCGTRIIPVAMEGFSWPRATELPEEIRAVCRINSLSFSSEFFNAFMDKLLGWME